MGFDGSIRPRANAIQRGTYGAGGIGGAYRQVQPPLAAGAAQQLQPAAGAAPYVALHATQQILHTTNVPVINLTGQTPLNSTAAAVHASSSSSSASPILTHPSAAATNNAAVVPSVNQQNLAMLHACNDSVTPDDGSMHQHHMDVEEHKEPKEPTLSERMVQLRDDGIGFDVQFHVGPSSKIILAHRAILAAGSKVFANTLYGSDATTPPNKKHKSGNAPNDDKLIVEFSDVNPKAFKVIVDFLYSDFEPNSIKVDESLVLDTLYAARKFEIDQLEKACIILLGDITPSMAVALLEQADKHRSEQLIEKCFEVIDGDSDGALSADSLVKLKKSTLKRIVDRSELTPSDEIMIFRAVCAWADAECQRQNERLATPQKKRQILGDVFNAVRFPTMGVDEFSEVANSGMLTDDEIGIIFRYISSTVRPAFTLPFPTNERRCLGRSKHVVKRFLTLSKNPCKKMRSSIWFIVNREILVTAFGVYGVIHASEANSEATEWETAIDIELACTEMGHHMKERNTVTLKGVYGDVRPMLARFKKPIRIAPNVPHRATVHFTEEVETYAGANGGEDIRVHISPGGVAAQESSIGGEGDSSLPTTTTDSNMVVHFAFHNDDPNGIRRGMTRGPAVFTNAIGGFYNRPTYRPVPSISEGCLYEGQIPEIHFLAPAIAKQEPTAAETD